MTSAGYIDGRFIQGEGETLVIEHPADESEIARFPGLTIEQFHASIIAARHAFDDGRWSGLTMQDRGETLRRFAEALTAISDQLADTIVAETGNPRHANSMNAQIWAPLRMAFECIDLFERLPEYEDNPLPLEQRVTPLGQVVQSLRRYTPIGVVAAIAPYNFPYYTAMWKVFPALMAGNSIVLRPNPLTPLSAILMAEAAHEAGLPPGVFNLSIEAGHQGAQLLTSHPAIDMVGFTGSSAVGAQVMAQAAPTFKRLQLELGGKSAQVFLPDSLDKVAAIAAGVCLGHAGQGCAHGTRVFVPEEHKAQLVAQTADRFRQLKVGPSKDPETQVGPVISRAQVERCAHFVKLAVEHGGRIAAGGRRPELLKRGHYFEPTLLDVPDNSNPAAQEEIFGPVVVVIGYRDLDHAVQMANDSPYGLSGYVFGQDKKQALDVATRIRSGAVHINAAVTSTYASFGGIKASGFGRERGIEGLRLYQNLSCLTLA